jgi:hypothetical protein
MLLANSNAKHLNMCAVAAMSQIKQNMCGGQHVSATMQGPFLYGIPASGSEVQNRKRL